MVKFSRKKPFRCTFAKHSMHAMIYRLLWAVLEEKKKAPCVATILFCHF
jgi:hypothetical protein